MKPDSFVTDWFVADETTFGAYRAAVAAGQPALPAEARVALAGSAETQGISPVDLGLLYAAFAGTPSDAALASADDAFEHLHVLDDGTHAVYLVVVDDHVVKALADADAAVDPGLIETWAALADAYYEIDDAASFLDTAAAQTLIDLCRAAGGTNCRLYACVRTEGAC